MKEDNTTKNGKKIKGKSWKQHIKDILDEAIEKSKDFNDEIENINKDFKNLQDRVNKIRNAEKKIDEILDNSMIKKEIDKDRLR